MKTYNLTSTTKGLMNETIYSYKSDDKGLAFCMHPKKAFSFVLYSRTPNMTKKEINTFFDTWMQTAIGPSAEFNDRIKTIQIA
jgi:hypothetical protein